MSKQYDEYIEEHKNNVAKAFKWLEINLPEALPSKNAGDEYSLCEHQCLFAHDASKYDEDEYDAYDKYFYGKNRSYEVVNNFNLAWLAHIHKNKHHWQHWVLINDDPDKGEIVLDMPDVYIIEMICDWWSFSWKQNKLDEIFNWYNEHKDHMKLGTYTRNRVGTILDMIKNKLAEMNSNGEN